MIFVSSYWDLNNIFDPGEYPLEYKAVHDLNSNNIAFANINGEFSLLVKDSGLFTIEPDTFSFFNEIPQCLAGWKQVLSFVSLALPLLLRKQESSLVGIS